FAICIAAVSSNAAFAQFINDSFSTFANGNLVGQNGWTQLASGPTPGNAPIQVVGGQVGIPVLGVQAATADNQDAYKAFTNVPAPAVGTTAVYVGLVMSVNASFTSPSPNPGTPTPSYFMALTDSPAGFANERLTAKDNGVGTGYFLGARVTGQAAYPFVFGTTSLTYGQVYNVVVEADMIAGLSNDMIKVYINPGLPTATPYLVETGTGTDPTALADIILSQFASTTVFENGVNIQSVKVNTDFFAVIPEPATLVLLGAGLLLARRRR